ncbi:hypothetical protein C0991_005696 [Blastosporella zonata]|nr:hypothetical protein C0991_005696 [Blastosporella zonata]
MYSGSPLSAHETDSNVIGLSTCESTTLPTSVDQRRMQRYSIAEEELARKFRKCRAERSPLELQIRTLKEATSILSAHAQDARERAEKLRGLLADRDMDPEAYESLKRERWFQEHRQGAADEEKRAVQQQLNLLSNPPPQATELQANGETPKERRCRQNLINFLESSATLPPVRIRKATSILIERPHRRRTMDRVSPMRLCTTSTVSRASFQPLRPMSLDGWTRRTRHISTPSTTTAVHPLPSPLQLVSEGDSDEALYPATETASSYVSTFTADSILSTPPTTAATLPPSRTFSGVKPETDDENGTATIYLDTPFLGVQYTPEDIDAPLPDYALDLFSRFDYNIDINISNAPGHQSLPARFSDIGPRRAPLQDKPTPARQSSSFLEVPSFSSPKRQDRKAPRLMKSSSQRHLTALFAIPEALSSRIGFDSEDKRTRAREPIPSSSPSKSSLASSAVSEEPKVDLTTKIRKRFSILRLGRS